MPNFEFLNSELVYQGRIFNVERILMRLPDGHTHYYDLVRHKGAVTLVPIDQNDNILFVNQYRMGADQDLLELPAGVLDDGESPEVCAAREIREETGSAARTIKKLGEFYLAPGYSSEFMFVFLAHDLYSSPLQADQDEFIRVVPIPIKEVYDMVSQGKINDGKTLAALLLARPELENKLK